MVEPGGDVEEFGDDVAGAVGFFAEDDVHEGLQLGGRGDDDLAEVKGGPLIGGQYSRDMRIGKWQGVGGEVGILDCDGEGWCGAGLRKGRERAPATLALL